MMTLSCLADYAIVAFSLLSVGSPIYAFAPPHVGRLLLREIHHDIIRVREPEVMSRRYHPSVQMLADPALDLTRTLADAWTSYNHALTDEPLLTKSITAAVILGSADMAGQVFENRSSSLDYNTVGQELDLGRAARFAFFGFVLQAPWNHFYYQVLDSVLPPTPDPFTLTTAIKVVIDQFIQAPIFTLLIFYFLGRLEGKSFEEIRVKVDNDYKDTMVANWKLWVPATIINLGFVSPTLRVLFLNCVFFFWSIFLSLKLNRDESSEDVPNN